MFHSVSFVCLLLGLFFLKFSIAEWICPPGNRFCYQRINKNPLTWNETRTRCAQIGAEIPGAIHLDELSRSWIQESPFWTSLCFNNGRLQWLGIHPYEENDLLFIDKLLPDLRSSYVVDDRMYCFHTGGNQVDQLKTFGLAIRDSQQPMSPICVSDHRSIRYPTGPVHRGYILSVSAVTEGADIDWGPIGQNRDGFMNIFGPKTKSLKLKCNVETSNDILNAISIRWLRNGAYIGNSSQEVSFDSEESLIPWIGFINCEAANGNSEAVQGQGFHLVMWNTVTARLVSTCVNCRLQNILEDAKNILRLFVETEIISGFGRSMEFFNEPPVIEKSCISFKIHIRNKRIDKFDFKMVQRLGKEFPMSVWAESRSLFLSSGLNLEIISPCNMALPQDRNNVTWVGYLGQTVPSGNFIEGPICVDDRGDVITRSCGLPNLRPIRFQECSAMKPRREEPQCFHGFEFSDGSCYRMTDFTNFATALTQCWAGWPIQPQVLMPEKLSNWVQISHEWMDRIRSMDPAKSSSLVWLPLRRLNQATPLHTPFWSWNADSNRWIGQPNLYNITDDENSLCAAYDLEGNRIRLQSCQSQLPMICNRPVLPQPISTLIESQTDHVDEYFCPPGWLTHWLVLDAGICYRRFTLKEPVNVDQAQEFCLQNGGHLATAPTHIMRIALEQVYAFFNNQSVVDSWIGLRNIGEQPGAFNWVDQLDIPSSTYTWQPYNEFANGYGVSTGISRMWWNWPRQVKLWGLICQKTVSNWQKGLRLHLEPSNNPIREGEYSLVFNYNPEPVVVEENPEPRMNNLETIKIAAQQQQHSYWVKSFWQTEFDVVCHFGSYVRRFSFPRGSRRQYRALVPVPTAMGSGPLTCEAWLNRPVFRFQSNTIIHRPSHWYNFIVVETRSKPSYSTQDFQQFNNNWNGGQTEDFMQRLNSIRFRFFRDMLNNLTVTSSAEFDNIYHHLSFFLPPEIQQFELLANARQCQRGLIGLNSEMDRESVLHLLLQSCLPLVYRGQEDSQLIEIRSTVACPPINSFEIPSRIVGPEILPRIDRLAWPRTLIGQMTRPIQSCCVGKHLVRRSCQGSFDRGAIWGPPEIVERTLETTTVCEIPDSKGAKLNELERMTKAAVIGSLSSADVTDSILKDLLDVWEQPDSSLADMEMTISILRQLLNASQNQTKFRLDRLQVIAILTRMVEAGQSPLVELQSLPQVLDDLIQLLSHLPVLGGRGTRLNIGRQVSIVAEGSESATVENGVSLAAGSLTTTIDLYGATVTLAKDAGYNGFLFTIVTVLPTELLGIDPLTKMVDMYAADVSDPTQTSLLGKYTPAGQTILHVDLKMLGISATLPTFKVLTLAFKAAQDVTGFPAGAGGALSMDQTSDYVCAKWDWPLNRSLLHTGGWKTGNCWYLGVDVIGRHFCQCHSAGIYSLFRSDGEKTRLRMALIRRLPIIINAASFLLIASLLIIHSLFIYRKSARQMDLVEMGARLQMVLAWTAMLFSNLFQYFILSGYMMMGCMVLTTLFQFFLTVAFIWQSALLLIRRWQIRNHWISHQRSSLVKFSLAVWLLSSVVVATIPIYKWKYLQRHLNTECWLQDPVDFGLTLAIVSIASLFSLILNGKNLVDQQKLIAATSEWNVNDWFAVANTPLMALAGLLAVINVSWLRSDTVAIVFSATSLLLAICWLLTFWNLVASPWQVKHNFQHSNRKISQQDVQLKNVQPSPVG